MAVIKESKMGFVQNCKPKINVALYQWHLSMLHYICKKDLEKFYAKYYVFHFEMGYCSKHNEEVMMIDEVSIYHGHKFYIIIITIELLSCIYRI